MAKYELLEKLHNPSLLFSNHASEEIIFFEHFINGWSRSILSSFFCFLFWMKIKILIQKFDICDFSCKVEKFSIWSNELLLSQPFPLKMVTKVRESFAVRLVNLLQYDTNSLLAQCKFTYNSWQTVVSVQRQMPVQSSFEQETGKILYFCYENIERISFRLVMALQFSDCILFTIKSWSYITVWCMQNMCKTS